MEKRPFVGLLTNDLVGTYQFTFWSGMKEAARGEDCDLASFGGGEIGSPDRSKAMRNSAFELVKPAGVDVLVLLPSVVANHAGTERTEAFIASFAPVPVLTVGFSVPGHASLLLDNTSGMDGLVEHLVVQHHRRNFAFLSGPRLNTDSMERRAAFVATLARHGIAFDPSLEFFGEFDFGTAKKRIREALDAGARFDALVAANDEMALAAMELLQERGLRVPDDVAVTGFDDIEEGGFCRPSLTTVSQSLFVHGANCLRRALDLLEGHRVEGPRQATRPVLRGSCGCHSRSLSLALHPGVSAVREGAFGGEDHQEDAWKACGIHLVSPRLADPLKVLVAALAADATRGESRASLSAFNFLVDLATRPGDDTNLWQDVITSLRAASLPHLPADTEVVIAFEGLLHALRVAAHERTAQDMAQIRQRSQRWIRSILNTGVELVEKFDLGRLVEVLARDAASMRFTGMQLLLREPHLDPRSFRLVLSILGGRRENLPPTGEIRPLPELFQTVVHESPIRSTLVVEPLSFGNQALGFLLLEIAERRGMLLDSLRAQISAAIMGSRILREAIPDSTGESDFLQED